MSAPVRQLEVHRDRPRSRGRISCPRGWRDSLARRPGREALPCQRCRCRGGPRLARLPPLPRAGPRGRLLPRWAGRVDLCRRRQRGSTAVHCRPPFRPACRRRPRSGLHHRRRRPVTGRHRPVPRHRQARRRRPPRRACCRRWRLRSPPPCARWWRRSSRRSRQPPHRRHPASRHRLGLRRSQAPRCRAPCLRWARGRPRRWRRRPPLRLCQCKPRRSPCCRGRLRSRRLRHRPAPPRPPRWPPGPQRRPTLPPRPCPPSPPDCSRLRLSAPTRRYRFHNVANRASCRRGSRRCWTAWPR